MSRCTGGNLGVDFGLHDETCGSALETEVLHARRRVNGRTLDVPALRLTRRGRTYDARRR